MRVSHRVIVAIVFVLDSRQVQRMMTKNLPQTYLLRGTKQRRPLRRPDKFLGTVPRAAGATRRG